MTVSLQIHGSQKGFYFLSPSLKVSTSVEDELSIQALILILSDSKII